MPIGSKNAQWKGSGASYKAVHIWVNRWMGKPTICEICGKTSKQAILWWANKSHLYKRDLTDYFGLCTKCHRKYDFTDRWRNNIRLSMLGNKNPFYGKKHTMATRLTLSRLAKLRKRKRNKLGRFL